MRTVKRQLSFALSLSTLISATAFAEDPESDMSLLNPQATCANYEKLEQACKAQEKRLRLLAEAEHKLLDADFAPALKAASDALAVFDGCTEFYFNEVKAGKGVTKDIEALTAAEKPCLNLVMTNVDGLPAKTIERRNEVRDEYYGLRDLATKILDWRAVSQIGKDNVEAKEANKAADKIQDGTNQIAKTMMDHDRDVRDKVKRKFPKVPGINSLGDAVKTALGLGTLGAGLGMGISDLLNMANPNLAPLVNPTGVAAPASVGDTSTEAASGGGVGSTNPSVADSSLVRLTAAVTEYADGRRVVDGETKGKLSSSGSGAKDEARGDNSGRSSSDTSASATLNSQSNGTTPALASGQTRSARTLSSDSSRRPQYVDEQDASDSAAESQKHNQAK